MNASDLRKIVTSYSEEEAKKILNGIEDKLRSAALNGQTSYRLDYKSDIHWEHLQKYVIEPLENLGFKVSRSTSLGIDFLVIMW